MNPEENKDWLGMSIEDGVDDLIDRSIDIPTPSLYHPVEIDGVIVKLYTFIQNRIHYRSGSLPMQELTDKYSSLSTRKIELENQLELHQKYCVEQYNRIKLKAYSWLENKIWEIGRPLNDHEQKIKLISFMAQVQTMISWVMEGMEIENVKDALNKNFSPRVEFKSLRSNRQNTPVILDINELIEIVKQPIEIIDRVVFRSESLYIVYVAIHGHLYKLDPESILQEIQKELNIDITQLEKIVERANELLTEDYEAFRVIKSNAIISNDLKNHLAEEFEKGPTTIYDWFKRYCEKVDNKTYQIKPKFNTSIKSDV